MRTFKHLSLDDRLFIQSALSDDLSLKHIASSLKKDPTTISKELKKHRLIQRTKNTHGILKNSCLLMTSCSKHALCSPKCFNPHISSGCRFCPTCNSQCPDYQISLCQRLKRYPHVCNGCSQFAKCRKPIKYKYDASLAHNAYTDSLVHSRTGINLDLKQLQTLEDIFAPRILLGQPIAHIYLNHQSSIPCSLRTIYTYVELGLFSFKNIDLQRKVRYKPRTVHKKLGTSTKEKRHNRINRTYRDYETHVLLHPNANIVQMDLVEGSKGGKLFLTFLFKQTNLMLIYLIDDKQCDTVFHVLESICHDLGISNFSRLFQILLTDNGSEFQFPEAFESLAPGCRMFYCDPGKSYQKGQLEKNHEYIRYILPKGTSFDDLTQEKVTLISNHINATFRPKMQFLENRSPYELSEFVFDKDILDLLGLSYINPDHVCLTASLIK